MGFKAGYRGFLDFAEAVGLALEPFQRKIARAAIESRELLALLPRGNPNRGSPWHARPLRVQRLVCDPAVIRAPTRARRPSPSRLSTRSPHLVVSELALEFGEYVGRPPSRAVARFD
jgi:hypothetical protein